MKTLGDIRREKGITQAVLGEAALVSQRSLASHEAGTRRPSPEVAERIAQALDMDLETMWAVLYGRRQASIPPSA